VFDKKSILKNVFDNDEKLIFSKALDRAYYCLKNYEPAFTEFLDPCKVSSIVSLLGKSYDFSIRVFGGMEACERCKIGFFPEFMPEEDYVFPISIIKVEYNAKFGGITHRSVLGSLIGLGIVRGKIGDILFRENAAFVFIDTNIADFVVMSFKKAGNTNVKARIVSLDEIGSSDVSGHLRNITLSSLRLDTVLSGAFNLSRGKASKLIKSEKAFVNWSVCESVSKPISENDMITLRGFGRVKIIQIIGKTKKDKFLVSINKF